MNAPATSATAPSGAVAIILAFIVAARTALAVALSGAVVDHVIALVSREAFVDALTVLLSQRNTFAVLPATASQLVAMLRAAEDSKRATTGRVFNARIDLFGHKHLGLCRVEEATLAGARSLRCTSLTTEPPIVQWVMPQSCYHVLEVDDDAAQVEVFEAAEAREESRTRAQRERAAIELRIAKQRTWRALCEVELAVVGTGDVTACALVSETGEPRPDALTTDDEDLPDALKAEGLATLGVSSYRRPPLLAGIRLWTDTFLDEQGSHASDHIDAITRVMLALGFHGVRLPQPAEPVVDAEFETNDAPSAPACSSCHDSGVNSAGMDCNACPPRTVDF